MSEDIGFLGLGQMGSAIAERLAGGDQLHLYDPVPANMAPFVARGAVAHGSAREVANAARIVFACLPSPEISLRTAQAVAGGEAVSTYVEMSTIGRPAMERIATLLALRRIVLVDAPVSGGPDGARAGKLAIMVAAEGPTLADARPYLERISSVLFEVGEAPGLGQTMKLMNNLMAAANLAIATETITAGVKAGLDPANMVRVINRSSGQNSATASIFPNYVLNGGSNFGAAMATMVKDVELGLAEAQALDLPMAMSDMVAALWRACAKTVGGDQDLTAFVLAQAKRAGVEIKAG